MWGRSSVCSVQLHLHPAKRLVCAWPCHRDPHSQALFRHRMPTKRSCVHWPIMMDPIAANDVSAWVLSWCRMSGECTCLPCSINGIDCSQVMGMCRKSAIAPCKNIFDEHTQSTIFQSFPQPKKAFSWWSMPPLPSDLNLFQLKRLETRVGRTRAARLRNSWWM